ncbi:MAG: hypothetical protein WCH35_06130, partial [Comamonadaceae bacterium]
LPWLVNSMTDVTLGHPKAVRLERRDTLHNSLPARKTAVVGRMTAAEFQGPPNAQIGPAVAMTGLEN